MPSVMQAAAAASRQPATQYHSRRGWTGALACADRMTSPSPFRRGSGQASRKPLIIRACITDRTYETPVQLTVGHALSVPPCIVVIARNFEEARMCCECDHPGGTRLDYLGHMCRVIAQHG